MKPAPAKEEKIETPVSLVQTETQRFKKRKFTPPIGPAQIHPITGKTPTTSWVRVTPQQAFKWLEESNLNNRPIRDEYVSRLAKDMLNKEWNGMNGEPIQFDTNGRLVNGQHRLWACIQAGIPFETLLITGVVPGSYNTIGIGATKSFSDFLGPNYGEKNTNALSAAVKMVYFWERGILAKLDAGNLLPTIREQSNEYLIHPKLRESVAWISSQKETKQIITPRFATLLHYAAVINNDQIFVEAFLIHLGSGLGIEESDDPLYLLRKQLLKLQHITLGQRKPGKLYVLACMLKAWNASKENRKMKTLRYKTGEEFPKLYGK